MEVKVQSLLANNYAPAVSNRLSRFPSRDQLTIASWLVQTPIGTNYALQIFEQLEDLSKKEEIAPAQVLTQILLTLQPDQYHPKEMGKQVRDELSKKLHPVSTDHREAFLKFSKTLDLPEGVQLHPPQNFEGTRFSLQLSFASVEELQKHLEKISASLQKNPWEKLKEF